MEINKLTYNEDSDFNECYHIWPNRSGEFFLTGTQGEGMGFDDTYGPFDTLKDAKDFAKIRRNTARTIVYRNGVSASRAVRIGNTSGAGGWDGTPDNWNDIATGVAMVRRSPANKFRFGWGGIAEYAGKLDA